MGKRGGIMLWNKQDKEINHNMEGQVWNPVENSIENQNIKKYG